MKKLFLGVLAAATVASPIALAAAPASANPGSPTCMTKSEWYRVHKGLNQTQVKNIVGTWGKVADRTDFGDGEVWITREYRQCNAKGKPVRGSWNTVYVDFSNYVDYDDDFNVITGPQRVSYKGAWSRPWF